MRSSVLMFSVILQELVYDTKIHFVVKTTGMPNVYGHMDFCVKEHVFIAISASE